MFRQVSLLTLVMPAMAFAGGENYFTGEGTSYTLGQVSSGNCNFMYDPGVGENYAALNNEQWDSTHNCGRCAEVSCDDSRCSDKTTTAIVYIVDRCPECVQGDLDLSPTVFKQLTGSDPSRYSIKWKFVDCPISGNIQYCTKSGSSNSWLAVQPTNFANGVASMKIANQEVTMVDSCYYFLLNGGANVDISAVDIELTSVSGETITETLSLTSDVCTVGTANFGTSTTQTDTSQTTPATQPTSAPAPATPATTTAPAVTTVAPISTTTTPKSTTAPLSGTSSQSQTQQQQSDETDNSLSLQTNSNFTTSGTKNYKAGTVIAAQEQPQQSEVSDGFLSLTVTSGSSSSGTNYKAGKVIAANESKDEVKILQSGESGVEDTPSVQQQDESDSTKQTADSDIEQVTTKSEASSSGASTVVVALLVLAVVGVIALAAVAYVVKKKKLDDKRIDRDMATMEAFDTFSSPVRFDATIAKI